MRKSGQDCKSNCQLQGRGVLERSPVCYLHSPTFITGMLQREGGRPIDQSVRCQPFLQTRCFSPAQGALEEIISCTPAYHAGITWLQDEMKPLQPPVWMYLGSSVRPQSAELSSWPERLPLSPVSCTAHPLPFHHDNEHT